MADLDVFKEDFALLFEAGMVAIKQGDEASAKALFQALSVLNPEHTAHELGIGLQRGFSEVLWRKILRIGVQKLSYR